MTHNPAETEADLTRIDWPARQAAAAIPFAVVNWRPVNPCEHTGRTGLHQMYAWGETLMADALVTLTYRGTRHLLMVERGDGYGWAVPGGHVDPGETGAEAALRELAEETGLVVTEAPPLSQVMPARYVPDPRASDEAWAVTIPVHIDLGEVDAPPAVKGDDDARTAQWLPATTYGVLESTLTAMGGEVFPAHVPMLTEFLERAS